MKEKIIRLLSIKSLVTLTLTGVFCCLTLQGRIAGRDFLTIFTTVIAFYFGTQTARREEGA